MIPPHLVSRSHQIRFTIRNVAFFNVSVMCKSPNADIVLNVELCSWINAYSCFKYHFGKKKYLKTTNNQLSFCYIMKTKSFLNNHRIKGKYIVVLKPKFKENKLHIVDTKFKVCCFQTRLKLLHCNRLWFHVQVILCP